MSQISHYSYYVCWDTYVWYSLASHTLRRERSGHAATIELLPRQKLALTNQIHALRRLHPLSWSSNYVVCLADVSILLSNCCVPRQQPDGCSMTGPFLSLQRVWLASLCMVWYISKALGHYELSITSVPKLFTISCTVKKSSMSVYLQP